ncbi:uncharacterized protein LOC127790845 isoform X1 [Diospyros lotus]|uniref:uncharacterized protein LOC127790845 isoform X1 n=1 Tax=Diospyros lotus TaxID=55363 RepID=UPI002250BF78|nr:uncharacterized protein LOC127790845 isoform X1 [Diospyros lotus]XP_052176525.1 uncharacterized protein LOC127790845 isoform X1 [Diospyros lotus]
MTCLKRRSITCPRSPVLVSTSARARVHARACACQCHHHPRVGVTRGCHECVQAPTCLLLCAHVSTTTRPRACTRVPTPSRDPVKATPMRPCQNHLRGSRQKDRVTRHLVASSIAINKGVLLPIRLDLALVECLVQFMVLIQGSHMFRNMLRDQSGFIFLLGFLHC